MNEKNENDVQELISEYYLRELTPEELNTLQEYLAEDSDARSDFVNTGRDEWLMHHVHHLDEQKITYLRPRLSNRRRIQAIAAGAAILATLGTLLFSKTATFSEMIASKPTAPVIGEVTDLFVLQGDAISVVNDGDVRKLNSASKIRDGDRVVIPPGSHLAFRYSEEETEIRLGGNSLVHLRDVDGAKFVRLDKGRLFATVDPQNKDKPMRVVTGDAEVVVLGTAFEVFSTFSTRLTVQSGKVRFNALNSEDSTEVSAGHYADTIDRKLQAISFKTIRLRPTLDHTIQNKRMKEFIQVDSQKGFEGFMKFDLSELSGTVLEATLKLHVTGYHTDQGGDGHLRLFSVPSDRKGQGERITVGQFNGRAGRGKDIRVDVDISKISAKEQAFVLALDKGGNDFWFSATEGDQAPVLELKVAK